MGFCFQILLIIAYGIWGNDRLRNQEFGGTITYKYKIREAHNSVYVFIDTCKDEIRLFDLKLFDTIDQGDYLIKRKGELRYLLVKKNDSVGNKDTQIFDEQPE